MNDVLINKIQSIQRGVARARAEYRSDPVGFGTVVLVMGVGSNVIPGILDPG